MAPESTISDAELDRRLALVRAAVLPPPEERRRIREDAGLSIAALARVIDVDPSSLAAWERGDRRPHHEHRAIYRAALVKLAADLGRQ